MAEGEDGPRHEEAKALYDAVARRALEEHVLALIVGWGRAEDELERQHHGREPLVAFRSAEIVGEPPDTAIKLRMYERGRSRFLDSTYSIWNIDDFELSDGKMRDPGYMASMMLLWARGG
jgi:hypothetical protein